MANSLFPESIPTRIKSTLKNLKLMNDEFEEFIEHSLSSQTSPYHPPKPRLLLPNSTVNQIIAAYYPEVFEVSETPNVTTRHDPNLQENTYNIQSNGFRNFTISYSSTPALFRSLLHAGCVPVFKNTQRTGQFERRTLLIDLAKGGVYTVSFLKRVIVWAALHGLTHITFNVECYELVDLPAHSFLYQVNKLSNQVGILTTQEIKELVEFAEQFEIVLYPTIQYAAFLEKILSLPEIKQWRNQKNIKILDPNDPHLSEQLLRPLIHSATAPYIGKLDSITINVSFDESEELNNANMFIKHVDKVSELLLQEAHNYHIQSENINLYLWANMLKDVDHEQRDKLPEKIKLLYWEYDEIDSKKINADIKSNYIHKNIPLYGMATSTLSHNQILPWHHRAVLNNQAIIDNALQHTMKEIMISMWHEDNAECPFSSVAGILTEWSTNLWGGNHFEADSILKATTEVPLELYELIDQLNTIDARIFDKQRFETTPNPLKTLLYENPQYGVFSLQHPQKYQRQLIQIQHNLQKIAEENQLTDHPLIEFATNLIDLLIHKLELTNAMNLVRSSKISPASLLQIRMDAIETVRALVSVWKSHAELWLKEKKVIGLDVIDHRYALLWNDINSCIQIIDGAVRDQKTTSFRPHINTHFPQSYRTHEEIVWPELLSS
ncbi:hypothetical protein HGA91_00030 [candidate division WWE3 bacterium]|nr:hypothetical protein [candidate division WWE3 bacterium]